MPCDPRKMRSELVRKLDAEESAGSKHWKYKVFHEGKLVGLTEVSYNAKEIPDGLVSSMANELCIPTQVLREIYRCPYGWEEYKEAHDPARSFIIRCSIQ